MIGRKDKFDRGIVTCSIGSIRKIIVTSFPIKRWGFYWRLLGGCYSPSPSLTKVGGVWALLLCRRADDLLCHELASSHCDKMIDSWWLGNHYFGSSMFLYCRYHRYRCALPESVDRWLLDQYDQFVGESQDMRCLTIGWCWWDRIG